MWINDARPGHLRKPDHEEPPTATLHLALSLLDPIDLLPLSRWVFALVALRGAMSVRRDR